MLVKNRAKTDTKKLRKSRIESFETPHHHFPAYCSRHKKMQVYAATSERSVPKDNGTCQDHRDPQWRGGRTSKPSEDLLNRISAVFFLPRESPTRE